MKQDINKLIQENINEILTESAQTIAAIQQIADKLKQQFGAITNRESARKFGELLGKEIAKHPELKNITAEVQQEQTIQESVRSWTMAAMMILQALTLGDGALSQQAAHIAADSAVNTIQKIEVVAQQPSQNPMKQYKQIKNKSEIPNYASKTDQQTNIDAPNASAQKDVKPYFIVKKLVKGDNIYTSGASSYEISQAESAARKQLLNKMKGEFRYMPQIDQDGYIRWQTQVNTGTPDMYKINIKHNASGESVELAQDAFTGKLTSESEQQLSAFKTHIQDIQNQNVNIANN